MPAFFNFSQLTLFDDNLESETEDHYGERPSNKEQNKCETTMH
ncbi:protein of unknown function [Legionella fallonii LLAP-10]|uniref:Uncharacterized protein n=1 Tax=Legionella fallonii LLAP-10 TaxID=1212491 RepID=A0A098G0K2_9GAMM|nr:protein of unknown function [Legionella fallonii LLAP-10]